MASLCPEHVGDVRAPRAPPARRKSPPGTKQKAKTTAVLLDTRNCCAGSCSAERRFLCLLQCQHTCTGESGVHADDYLQRPRSERAAGGVGACLCLPPSLGGILVRLVLPNVTPIAAAAQLSVLTLRALFFSRLHRSLCAAVPRAVPTPARFLSLLPAAVSSSPLAGCMFSATLNTGIVLEPNFLYLWRARCSLKCPFPRLPVSPYSHSRCSSSPTVKSPVLRGFNAQAQFLLQGSLLQRSD